MGVVLSVVIAATQSAPQLLGYPYGLGYAYTITHAVPTTVKKTFTYKTAAFEPVEADTPADAKLIELKETEHSYDALVPGPVKYVSSVVPAVAGYHLPYYGLPVVAAPAAELPSRKPLNKYFM